MTKSLVNDGENEAPRRKQRGINIDFYFIIAASGGELTLRD
ncbi:MAG TPA: hypothetical protein VIK14_05870 [Ignavibacteria bacterium]